MRVPVYVDLGCREIEVEVSGEDMVAAIIESSDGKTAPRHLLRICNNVGGFFLKLPDSVIAELSDAQRRGHRGFL
jgi:hypothetical protein